MSNNTCPVCSSTNLKKGTVKNKFTDNFGGSIEFDIIELTCEDCETTGDFFKENDEILARSSQELKERAVVKILEYFAYNKINFASMERVLGLPQRTLTKWKTKANPPTAAGITLLKFLKTFPWLLDVADSKFEYSASQKIHLDAFLKTLMSQTSIIKDPNKNVDYYSQDISSLALATSFLTTKRLSALLEEGLSITSNAETGIWSVREEIGINSTNEESQFITKTF